MYLFEKYFLEYRNNEKFLIAVFILCIFLIFLCLYLFNYRPLVVKPNFSTIKIVNISSVVSNAVLQPLEELAIRPKILNIVEKPITLLPKPTPVGGGVVRKIAFASNRADGRYYQLYMMNSDGSAIERLTEAKAFDRDPHFSHDGTRLAFASNRTGAYQIYVLDLATRAVKCLTQGKYDKTNPFWSPDDSEILFTMHKKGSSHLGIMQINGKNIRQLTNDYGDSHGYGFSPDGSKVSFESTMNDRNEIFILDLRSQKSKPLLNMLDSTSYRGDPVFSPLGDKMIFSSNEKHNTRQLYMLDLQTKKYIKISKDNLDKDDPVFSPDGTMIAYVACWGNAWNIFITDVSGLKVTNITQSNYDNLVPSWR